MATRELKLRRPDRCVKCGVDLATGTVATWDGTARTVTCLSCARSVPPPGFVQPIDSVYLGEPGASLDRQANRRREIRNRRATAAGSPATLTSKHALQREQALRKGSKGEKDVADAIARRIKKQHVVTLHNRRYRAGRGDIDHISVAPSGVYVVDAKAIRGDVRVMLKRGAPTLMVAGRRGTKFVHGLDHQLVVVRWALRECGCGHVPVLGVLCLTEADLPLLSAVSYRGLSIDGHAVLYRRQLVKRLDADGPLGSGEIDAIASRLAELLPPA